ERCEICAWEDGRHAEPALVTCGHDVARFAAPGTGEPPQIVDRDRRLIRKRDERAIAARRKPCDACANGAAEPFAPFAIDDYGSTGMPQQCRELRCVCSEHDRDGMARELHRIG